MSWSEIAKKLEKTLEEKKGRKMVVVQECDVETLCEIILTLVHFRDSCRIEEDEVDGTPLTFVWLLNDTGIAIDNLRARCWFVQLL